MSDEEVAGGLWQSILTRLSSDETITPQQKGFLNLVTPKGVIGDTFYLEVPSDLARSMIDVKLRSNLLTSMLPNVEFGGPTQFAVVVNPNIEPALEGQPVDAETLAAPLPEPVDPARRGASEATTENRLNPRYTFDNFVTGESNRFAHAAAFAVAEVPAQSYNPLFIYGSSGLGKTHLLHAIGHYALNLRPKLKVRYVSSEEFTNDFINSIQNNRQATFMATYREIDVLLIDDIQFLQGKEETQEAFFYTFNTLYDHNKQVVITSDLPPKQLEGFEDRMLSRFEWGLLTDIQAPQLETRIAILRKKAETEKLRVPDEILEYMAERVSSNIRELEGTLIRVTAYANLNRSQVDLQLVQTILKDIVPIGETSVYAPIDIIKVVADYYNISPDEIYGSSRQQAIAMARQIAMYIIREQTQLSLPKIGQLFSNRDHTTVMYACKKVNNYIQERRSVYNQVTEILNKLKNQKS